MTLFNLAGVSPVDRRCVKSNTLTLTIDTGSSVTNEELQKQQGMYATLEGTCQELRTARDDLSRNNAVLKERVENLTNNYDNLKSDYQRQGTALSGREEENIGLQKSISAIGQDKAQLEGKLDASAKSVVRLEDEVTRVRDKISRLEQERNELTSRLASSGAELARTQAERDSNASRVAETQTLVKSRDERIKTQQEMLLNAASNEGTISGLTDQIERAWTARENADKALEAMRKAKDALERKAQGLEDTLEATKEEMASVQSQFDSATNNSNMQVEALQKAAEQQKNTIDNLHTGVRRILDDGDQSVINLGKEDDVTNALHIVVMTETELEERHARQEEPGAFQPLWTELLATHFQTKITPKSLATLLKYIAHSGNHHVVGEIDDLAHLQMDWVRHPRSANEPSWVWFDIGVILEKSLRVAFEQRDALRLCMILSLSTQLDHILGPLNKTSFLRDQVDQDFFKEMILGLGLMGFIPFVMVSRYLAAHGQLRWMDDQPGYEKLYGGRNRKMLSAWASEVPRQTNLVRVINSMEMQELAISFHTLRWEKTERSTGYKISFFMQLTTGVSTLENESMMFLEVPPVVNPDADDTTAPTPDSVVVFNPPFDIQVEITERHYELRMKFKKGSEGFKVNIANKNDNLLKWVKRFHNDRYKEAVSIASRNDTVLNLKVPKVEGIDQ